MVTSGVRKLGLSDEEIQKVKEEWEEKQLRKAEKEKEQKEKEKSKDSEVKRCEILISLLNSGSKVIACEKPNKSVVYALSIMG